VNKPEVTEGIGSINYAWPELRLRVVAERYTDDGYAELRFYLKDGAEEKLIHPARANLLATSTMNSLVKRLRENSQEIPWTDVLTFIAGKTLEIARRTEPVKEIWPLEDDTLEVSYLLRPILPEKHPTVIFGDYGSLKSLVALGIGYIVQLPYQNNQLGLTTAETSTRCLFCDYEDDPSSFRKRWGAIQRGFAVEAPMPILYRHMTVPFIDAIEQLRQTIAEERIGLMIVDSLGPAARGNLNDPEPAIKYHAALRQLGITSLTLAHNSKDPITKRRTIFGSVFFTNLARSVWECKAEQEPGEDEAIISLKHHKANLSRLQPALGYKFTFTDNSISIAKTDLRDTGLSSELPLSVRTKDLLRRGAMTVKGIAESLDANEGSVKTTLNRLAKKGTTIKTGELWGLKAL
jgi:hypothetical protein